MKKFWILLVILLPFRVFSQKLVFCEKVGKDGKEINPSSIFYIDPKGGFFNVLVKLEEGLTSDLVIYDFYLVDETSGKEVFHNSIRMAVQPGISWFYKEITFYKKGKYHVYVYDSHDRLLAVGKVQVAFTGN
jgi:hypothetical protein